MKKQILPECRVTMQPYLDDIWERFFEIFTDSRYQLREKFFQEPLIRFLWVKFVECCSKEITEIIGDSHNKDLFLLDIRKMELLANCLIIP